MIAEAKYLLKSMNKRVIVGLMVAGLIVGMIPVTAINAAGVAVSSASYIDGAGGTQGMDVYSSGGSNRPAIIFVHGGGWRAGDKAQYAGLANDAANRGYVGVSINYRLGPGGIYYQYEDVMRAVAEVRNNGPKYGIDPNRVAIWGDSAGGSLAMRIASSGQSGLAAAVGWSAPVNAYTAIFNSPESFAIGMDHSTCVPTDPASISNLVNRLPASNGNSDTSAQMQTGTTFNDQLQSLGSSDTTTSTPVTGIGSGTMGNIGSIASMLSAGSAQSAGQTDTSTQAGIAQVMGLITQFTNSSSDPAIRNAGTGISQLSQSTGGGGSTPSIYDPRSESASAEVKAAAARSPLVANAMHTAESQVPPQAQKAVLAITDALGCQDNFRVLSPTLIAAPNTPPTFLVNAQSETLVHPGQALEYRDKLRSMGIVSDALILPGANHMGYDERAVVPTFDFLAAQLRP